METRLATAADADALTALHAASFGAAPWDAKQIAGSLKNEIVETFVAPAAGRPQGFIMLQLVGEEAEIITFCVAPAARRQGMGQLLLAAALDAARGNKTRRLFLEVAADNHAALALYKKNNFHAQGKRAGYYRHGRVAVDAVTLALET